MGSCAAPSAKGDDKFITTDYLQQCQENTRRKVLVGAWILGKVENGEWPEQRLLDGLDSYLERDHDRALFGLPPKQKQQPQEHGQPEPQG
ncbi:hypothetical protein SNB41_11155 [Escherichia coli]|nr:hypothetical protein [Escherichia coli]